MVKSVGNRLTNWRRFGLLCSGVCSEFNVNNITMEFSCHSKKPGNVCRLETDSANSVQEFGDCVGDKQLSLAISH